MMSARPLLCAAAMLVLVNCQCGCHPRTGPGASPPVSSSSSSSHAAGGGTGQGAAPSAPATWPYWPVSMRVHPLTRLTSDHLTGQAIIECRLEFQDADGQTSRAVGQLTVQLHPGSLAAPGAGPIETWNQDLRDLVINRRQYDDVTRTYLFRLQLTQPPPAGCEVRAYFLSDDGQRLSATVRLRQ